MDRYSGAVTLIGLMAYYMLASRTTGSRSSAGLHAGRLAHGELHTRARAEAVGIECKEGFFQRTERIIVLIVGLVTGWMPPCCGCWRFSPM